MSVEILRLRSGEDIMCEIQSEDAVGYTIVDPAVIMPMGKTESGAIQIGLSPWMPYADTKVFKLPRDFVVTMAEPSTEIAQTYAEMFGTIFTPKQQILM
jgi:hypothetical protein